MPETKLDLNDLANRENVKITITTIEEAAERESRLKISEADAVHQRRKELILYSLTSGVIAVTVLLCAWIILRKGISTEDGKLALALLTAIVTGLVGYVTGQAAKKSSG